jgi:hypothetical protein
MNCESPYGWQCTQRTLDGSVILRGVGIVADRFCGLVIRIPNYRYRGSEFNFLRYQIFWKVVGLEQPHEDNWGATWKKQFQLWPRNLRLMAVGMCCILHATPSTHKVNTGFPGLGRHWVCMYSPADRFQRSTGFVRFEVFMAVTMKNGVFWDVTPCGSCKNRRFGGT